MQYGNSIWAFNLSNEVYRVHPEFSMQDYGYKSFITILESMQAKKVLELKYDDTRSDWCIHLIQGKGQMHEKEFATKPPHKQQPTPTRKSSTISESLPQSFGSRQKMEAANDVSRIGNDEYAYTKILDVLCKVELIRDPVWMSFLKQAIVLEHPGFNERKHGYRSFKAILEDMQAKKLIELECDSNRDNWMVRTKESRSVASNHLGVD